MQISGEMIDQEIQNALKVLRDGGTILYPTDTIWGIGCDATNEKAVEKVLRIKTATPSLKGGENLTSPLQGMGVREGKSFIVLVSDDGMLNRFVKDVPEMAWDLMDANDTEEDDEPGKPITIIYDSARGLAKNVLAEDGSIGIRMVKPARRGGEGFCHKMIHKFSRPVVSTSANISGVPAPRNFLEISDEIVQSVDYVVYWKQHENGNTQPSSIIKLKTNGEFKIIRE